MKKTTKTEENAEKFRIGFLVHDVSRLRRVFFDSEMKPLGITRSQWWVLAQLSRKLGRDGDEGVLQTELAKFLDVGKVAVGGLIDRLEAGGFVERRPDARDRRAKRVVITPKGRETLGMMKEVGDRLNEKIFRGISQEEVGVADRVLTIIKKNILEEMGRSGGSLEPRDD